MLLQFFQFYFTCSKCEPLDANVCVYRNKATNPPSRKRLDKLQSRINSLERKFEVNFTYRQM